MATISTTITKQPFKLIEIPLNKFKDEAVPHHQALFETHKTTVQKYLNSNNWDQLNREVKDKKRVVRQLKDLMYELDTLRTQVGDADLVRFDSQTLSLRKTILGLISSYAELEAKAVKVIQNYVQEANSKNENTLQGALQIQIHEDLTDLKLEESKQRLRQVEALHKDIEDVHEIFVDLNQMVGDQREHVDVVEANAEVASENIKGGLQHLIQASRLKKASYPVAGAFIGTIVGGPVGSIAGLKIGGLAAIGCGLVGYVSGRFIKKVNDNEISTMEVDINATANNTDAAAPTTACEKKDI